MFPNRIQNTSLYYIVNFGAPKPADLKELFYDEKLGYFEYAKEMTVSASGLVSSQLFFTFAHNDNSLARKYEKLIFFFNGICMIYLLVG